MDLFRKKPVLVEVISLPKELYSLLRNVLGLRPARQILIYGGNMGLSITAGAAALLVQLVPLPSGSVFDSPPDLALTCSDPAVVITPEAGDTTGTLFNVSAPASDTNTSATLNATGEAGGVQITGSAALTIVPSAPPPPTPATSIGIVAAPGQTAPAAAAVKARAPAK